MTRLRYFHQPAVACLITVLCFSSMAAKAAIGVGDIAVVGWNSDPAASTKDFAVVALKTIASGEVIFFTDKGISGGAWQADLGTEGIFSLTTTVSIAAGTLIRFSVTSGTTPAVVSSPSVGTLSVTNGWTSTSTASPFGNNGDQIIIYQGSFASPTFIFAFTSTINTLGLTNGWNTGGSAANNYSEIPAGLTNGTNAVSHAGAGALDNYVYTGTRAGTKNELLAAITAASNWTADDATAYNLSPGGTQFSGAQPVFAVSGTLPVKLTAFDARQQNHAILLNWETAMELNSDKYTVFHSADGSNWQKVGEVKAASNSTTSRKYQFLHQLPMPYDNYYRLRMEDMDGVYEWSKVIRIKTFRTGLTSPVYPIPADNYIIVLPPANAAAGYPTYRIIDISGRQWKTGRLRGNSEKISIEGLSSGTYWIYMKDTAPVKFLKK